MVITENYRSMKLQTKYKSIHIFKEVSKYALLFIICYALLFLELDFLLILGLIIIINVIFIKLELKYHLSTQLAKLIKEEKFQEALEFGLLKNAEQKDDYSKLLMLTAYYKIGNKYNALRLLKGLDKGKWKTRKIRKIVDNWKVKILLDSPYQLN